MPSGKYTLTLTKVGFETLITDINITGKIKRDFLLKATTSEKEVKKSVFPSIYDKNYSPVPMPELTVKPTDIISFPSIPPTVVPSPVNNPVTNKY